MNPLKSLDVTTIIGNRISIRQLNNSNSRKVNNLKNIKSITFFTICSKKSPFAATAVSVNMVGTGPTVQARITGALIDICFSKKKSKKRKCPFTIARTPHVHRLPLAYQMKKLERGFLVVIRYFKTIL